MLSMPAATFTFTPCLHGWYWHLVVVVLCTIYYFALCLSSLRHLFMYACIHICVHSVISIYLVEWSMTATVLGDCWFVPATVIDSHTCFCIHWLACIPALALSCIEIYITSNGLWIVIGHNSTDTLKMLFKSYLMKFPFVFSHKIFYFRTPEASHVFAHSLTCLYSCVRIVLYRNSDPIDCIMIWNNIINITSAFELLVVIESICWKCFSKDISWNYLLYIHIRFFIFGPRRTSTYLCIHWLDCIPALTEISVWWLCVVAGIPIVGLWRIAIYLMTHFCWHKLWIVYICISHIYIYTYIHIYEYI